MSRIEEKIEGYLDEKNQKGKKEVDQITKSDLKWIGSRMKDVQNNIDRIKDAVKDGDGEQIFKNLQMLKRQIETIEGSSGVGRKYNIPDYKI